MAWLAALKHVVFAFEFAAEVLREKLAAQDPILRHSDYETYVDDKSVSHPELARLTAHRRAKSGRFFCACSQKRACLVKAPHGNYPTSVLSPAVLHAITSDSPRWLAGFLVPDTEIGGL